MRNAVSSLAIYLDESTDLSSTAHGLLCATFFDEDLKFRDELIDIFDVSEEGAMVGASLEDKVYKILNTAKLVEYVDASFVDSASNVSDYPQRGYMHSYTALQKKHFAKLSTSAPCGQSPPSTKILITWWCLAHRFNLALGDVLKSAACTDVVKFLRLLVSFCHKSSHKGQLDAAAGKIRDFIDTFSKSIYHLSYNCRFDPL